jgi:hypothetical protein
MGHTQPPRDLIGLARDEQIDPIMLLTQLRVEIILESAQRRVLAPWDCNCCGLVLGGVDLDVVFQRIVVNVIWVPAH